MNIGKQNGDIQQDEVIKIFKADIENSGRLLKNSK